MAVTLTYQELIAERHNAQFIDEVQPTSAVEVEDSAEGARMSLEVELGRLTECVVVTQSQDVILRPTRPQATQPGARHPLQRAPHHLLLRAAYDVTHRYVISLNIIW